ncbi:MAG: outer membrane protein assembly factor BamA [Brevinematia bacterium]
MKRFFFVVFVLLLSSYSFGSWEEIEGYKIRSIVFEGVSKNAQDLIKDVLTIKEGEVIDFNKIINDTKSIQSIGVFYDFRLEYQIVDKTQKLVDIYIVGKEASILGDIKFLGNKTINSDDLKEVIYLSKGDYVSEYKIYASIAAIKQKYREEGLLDVSVKHYFTTEGKDIVLNFEINEGPRTIVKGISVVGSSNVTENELKSIIDTKEESKFLGIPINKGNFDPDKFSKDIEKIEYYYQTKGFIDAKVVSTNFVISNVFDNKTNLVEKDIYINIQLNEGRKYYFGGVSITGDVKLFSKDELLNKFPLVKGDSFSMDQIDKWLYSVNRKYWDRGYIFARVDKKLKKDESNGFVDLEVVIYEGEIGHVGSIIVVGNTYTKTYVIEREIEIKEGEIFSVNKLQRSVERLNMTQYFDKVEWEVKEGEAEGIMDLIFKVKEGRPGLISLGGGYGTVSGFSVNGSISHINLFGTGKKIQGKVDIGQNQQGISLTFTEPYLFNSKFSLSTSIYFYNTLIQNVMVDDDLNGVPESTNGGYWQTRLGFGLNVGRRIGSYYTLGVGYSIYNLLTHDKNFVNAYDTNINQELSLTYSTNLWDIFATGKLKSTASLSFSFDSRNHPLVPSKGVNGGIFFDYTGFLLGGFFEFMKLSGNFSFYQAIPVVEDYSLVWVLYTSHGIMLPQFDGVLRYEASDLFWFDGYYELRGWGGAGLRGVLKSFYSTELRLPIYGNELWGTFFLDYGSVFQTPQEYTTSPQSYYGSFGLGVMINIPSFPIRMYLARQFNPQENGINLYGSDQFFNNWQFVFAIQGLF